MMEDVGSADSSDDLNDGLVANFGRRLSTISTDEEIPITRVNSDGLVGLVNALATTPPGSKVGLKIVENEKKVTYNSCTFRTYHYGDSPPPESASASPGVTRLLEGKFDLFKDKPLHPEAQVFRGRQFFSADSREVAIKLIPSQENREKELELHKNLHHSNIVQLFDCGLAIGPINFTYVVMELCSQNLEKYVTTNQNKSLDFQKCSSYSKHILDGLSYLQKQNIVHRDLRPTNILLTDCGMTAKITDFKFARDLTKSQTSTITSRICVGTNGYRAPELLKLNNPTGSFPADIFSYGVIVCYMFSKGRHPFGANPHKWAANIIDDATPDLSIISRSNQSVASRDHLLDLLPGCLKHHPRDRWNVGKLQKHAFFTHNAIPGRRNTSKERTARQRTTSERSTKSSLSCPAFPDLDLTSKEKISVGSIKTPTKIEVMGGISGSESPPTRNCRRDLKDEFSNVSDHDVRVSQRRNEIKQSLRKSFSYLALQEIACRVDELEQIGGYDELDTALQMTGCELHLNRLREETSIQRVRALLPSSSSPLDVRRQADGYSIDKRYSSALILYRISTDMYLRQNHSPDDVAEWIKRIANGISETCVRLKYGRCTSHEVAINYGAKYLEQLLEILRSTPNLHRSVASVTETVCQQLVDKIYRQSNELDGSNAHARGTMSRFVRARTNPNF